MFIHGHRGRATVLVLVIVGFVVVAVVSFGIGVAVGVGGRAVAGSAQPVKPVPMLCRFNGTLFGQGFTAVCTNGSGDLIRNLRVKARNESLKQEKVWTYPAVAGSAWFQIGPDNGWTFYPGDIITFEADGFAPVTNQFIPTK